MGNLGKEDRAQWSYRLGHKCLHPVSCLSLALAKSQLSTVSQYWQCPGAQNTVRHYPVPQHAASLLPAGVSAPNEEFFLECVKRYLVEEKSVFWGEYCQPRVLSFFFVFFVFF